MTTAGFKGWVRAGEGEGRLLGAECRGRGRRGVGMRYRVRQQGGDNSAGTANDLGNKKTNNALRDKTCPGFDVARCCGKQPAVGQGFPGRQDEMGRTRVKTRLRKMRTGNKI
eukprot:CAMPEP_0172584500 /NCGR_PEP_ID=MMETSP1068-20121228/4099_1 /TAXON_ID=35684 /ORGANISM="Pseudopedinella elastica, Strain CCMP716" /LENGTH=111 /DNA_ID=CAMNT_0013378705 /DNA_START=371 /DNA_END=703 /DNA_ORIENTATION=-